MGTSESTLTSTLYSTLFFPPLRLSSAAHKAVLRWELLELRALRVLQEKGHRVQPVLSISENLVVTRLLLVTLTL